MFLLKKRKFRDESFGVVLILHGEEIVLGGKMYFPWKWKTDLTASSPLKMLPKEAGEKSSNLPSFFQHPIAWPKDVFVPLVVSKSVVFHVPSLYRKGRKTKNKSTKHISVVGWFKRKNLGRLKYGMYFVS